MSILDIIIFLFFTGGVVVFGCSFFNKKRSSEEFTSADVPFRVGLWECLFSQRM